MLHYNATFKRKLINKCFAFPKNTNQINFFKTYIVFLRIALQAKKYRLHPRYKLFQNKEILKNQLLKEYQSLL